MGIVGARVLGRYGWIVRFRLDDGTCVDRDFSLVRGGVLDFVREDRRKFRRIGIVDGCPAWRGRDGRLIDLCPDAILRGGAGRGRPARFAIIGAGGTLIPWRRSGRSLQGS